MYDTGLWHHDHHRNANTTFVSDVLRPSEELREKDILLGA